MAVFKKLFHSKFLVFILSSVCTTLQAVPVVALKESGPVVSQEVRYLCSTQTDVERDCLAFFNKFPNAISHLNRVVKVTESDLPDIDKFSSLENYVYQSTSWSPLKSGIHEITLPRDSLILPFNCKYRVVGVHESDRNT